MLDFEPSFGRLENPDERDSLFPVSAVLPEPSPFITEKYWWDGGWWGNQGSTSMCVVYSWMHWLEDGPVVQDAVANRQKPMFDLKQFYHECQLRDPWPGTNYPGTSVRTAAKILKELDIISEYRWANNSEEVAQTILNLGPMVVGTKWTKDMATPPSSGRIRPTGTNYGGHAYVLNGVDYNKKLFRIKNSWGRCFDDKTEILTEDGWKLFTELTGSEKVATLNPDTHNLEYNKIEEYHVYPYEGLMYNYTSSSVDLCVTPNHNLYIRSRASKEWKLEEAQNISVKHFGMKKDAEWVGEDIEYYEFDGYKIPMVDWVEFLGYFLSEGYTTSHSFFRKPRTRVRKKTNKDGTITEYEVREKSGYTQTSYVTGICQNKDQNLEKMGACLARLPFNFSRGDKSGSWTCNNLSLYAELEKYGKSYQKYIPDYVKTLNKELLSVFYSALMLGDGTESIGTNGSIKRAYYTSSKKLADDFQELLLKIGYAGDIKTIDRVGRRNKRGTTRHIEYRINIKQNSTTPDPGAGFVPKKTQYHGNVYCVTARNHIIYVRRNGKAVWSGNSWGKDGYAFISFSDFDNLLSMGGEACVAFEKKVESVPTFEGLSPPTSA